jgi:hypothetical protein
VKWPDEFERARNELLTAKLYELAGVDVPDYRFVTMNGKKGIASRYVEGLVKDEAKLAAGAPGVADGFVADAWLANWDVIGQNFDNMLVNGSKAFRVDTGGGLLYRAQGGAKGQAFGTSVDELTTLRSASKNRQAATVFNSLTDSQIEASAARVLLVKDADIKDLVELYGPTNAAERAKLAETLLARKADIARRFPQVGEAAQKAKKQAMEQAQFAAQDGLQEINGSILTAIKGIASRAANGGVLEAKDIQRVAEAKKSIESWIKNH